MRKLIAAFLLTGTAVAGPAIAADMPYYPPVIEIPDVDYGVSGSFYLRGSAAGNAMWAKEVFHPTANPRTYAITDFGYGYSVGAGVGYETGTGLRVDATVDYLSNDNMRANIADTTGTLTNGVYGLKFRSTVALVNAYYDFGFGDMGYGAAGGAFGYVGAGAGLAFNEVVTTGPVGAPPDTRGTNTSLAAAGMLGVGYDFGHIVADVGYRGLYIDSLANNTTTEPYSINGAWVHEVRGTLRYRFN
ncbi:hypothetical protein [Devosia sp.]|uniref:hypothetical protein n=1 Tax=Devosia sp. TaxID=1871048 RepID=UPI0025CC2C91|nr:hypothetical protein [Devosia sp.]MCR6636965.1 hypothetical protein [Devosia sp.]